MPFCGDSFSREQNMREDRYILCLTLRPVKEGTTGRTSGIRPGDQVNYSVGVMSCQEILSFPKTKKKIATVFLEKWSNAWLRSQAMYWLN